MSFADIANERGMTAAASLLGELTWEVDPHGYQRVIRRGFPAEAPLDGMLKFATRLGLVPELSAYLLEAFVDRPMERALIAYDIAATSLLGDNDTALLERVAAALAPLRPLGPVAPVAIPNDRVAAFVSALTGASTAVSAHDLPSLAAVARAASLDDAEPVIAHAKLLSRAHLPSLALAFLQLLWHRFASRPALEEMVEVALDHDMAAALPQLPVDDDAALQLHAYALVRTWLANFNTVLARGFLGDADQHPAIRDSQDPRLLVARADLASLERQPVPRALEDALEQMGSPRQGWYYATRVRDAVAIRSSPSSSLGRLDSFVCDYGNNAYLWAAARDDDARRAELLPLLSRELRFASYDPHVWRAVSIFVENGEAIGMQLDQRMLTQLATAFAAPVMPAAPGAPSAALRQLELLCARRRYANGGLSHHGMWEQFAERNATDEERAEMAATYSECSTLLRESTRALDALVAKLRAEAPHEIASWADTHHAYLARIIEEQSALGEDGERYVDAAKADQAEWAKVRAGTLAVVEERSYYGAERDALYRQTFGFDRDDRSKPA